MLLPGGMRAGIAAAIFLPAADSMSAAPGSIFPDIDLMRWRMLLKILAVVGQAGNP